MVNYCQPMAQSWENPRIEQKPESPDRYAGAGVNVEAGNEAVRPVQRQQRRGAP